MPPPRRRKVTSPKPWLAISAASSSGPGKRRTLAGRYVYALPPGRILPGERDQDLEPEPVEVPQQPARPRDLEDSDPAARAQHSPQLGKRLLEVGDVADAEADGGRVEGRILERQLQQIALDPLDFGVLPPSALEHPLREVEADHVRPGLPRRDREIARATAGVEHAIAGRNDDPDREPPPALVEADGHDAVHQVVDRGDPVEHRADAFRGEGPGLVRLIAPALTSVLSSPSWSRIRATMKSTRSSMVSAPW